MKKQLMIFGILGFGFLGVLGQELHTPAEIFEIMEKSAVTYELNTLEKEILPEDRTNNLNYSHYYRVNDEGVMSTEL